MNKRLVSTYREEMCKCSEWILNRVKECCGRRYCIDNFYKEEIVENNFFETMRL